MEKIDILRTMRAHGFMAKDIAEKLGITTVAMSQQMTGNPRLDTLRKTADAIGCNIRDFFYLVDEEGNDLPKSEGDRSPSAQGDLFSSAQKNGETSPTAPAQTFSRADGLLNVDKEGAMAGFFVCCGKKFKIVECD